VGVAPIALRASLLPLVSCDTAWTPRACEPVESNASAEGPTTPRLSWVPRLPRRPARLPLRFARLVGVALAATRVSCHLLASGEAASTPRACEPVESNASADGPNTPRLPRAPRLPRRPARLPLRLSRFVGAAPAASGTPHHFPASGDAATTSRACEPNMSVWLGGSRAPSRSNAPASPPGSGSDTSSGSTSAVPLEDIRAHSMGCTSTVRSGDDCVHPLRGDSTLLAGGRCARSSGRTANMLPGASCAHSRSDASASSSGGGSVCSWGNTPALLPSGGHCVRSPGSTSTDDCGYRPSGGAVSGLQGSASTDSWVRVAPARASVSWLWSRASLGAPPALWLWSSASLGSSPALRPWPCTSQGVAPVPWPCSRGLLGALLALWLWVRLAPGHM